MATSLRLVAAVWDQASDLSLTGGVRALLMPLPPTKVWDLVSLRTIVRSQTMLSDVAGLGTQKEGNPMVFQLPRELLKLAAGGVLMVLAAAVHSPYAQNLAAIWQ